MSIAFYWNQHVSLLITKTISMKNKLSIEDFSKRPTVEKITGDNLKKIKGGGGEDGCPPPLDWSR